MRSQILSQTTNYNKQYILNFLHSMTVMTQVRLYELATLAEKSGALATVLGTDAEYLQPLLKFRPTHDAAVEVFQKVLNPQNIW